MSRPDDGSRTTEVGRLDLAIDRAVREMLDVEPPAGLRGRVLDRIATPRRGLGWMWIAGPLAAAAVLVLAVLTPWGNRRSLPPSAPVISDRRPPVPDTAGPPPAPPMTRQTVIAHGRPRPPRVEQTVRAAAVATSEEFAGAQIEPLAGPAPLAVERLTGPPAPAVENADVMPIRIRALEVSAITETPRERREE